MLNEITKTALLLVSVCCILVGNNNAKADSDYLVVSFVSAESEYSEAARLLAERHDAQTVYSSLYKFDELKEKLLELQPQTVAFIVKPEDLQVNFVEQILVLSTQMDFDPFVDFSYGFITGRDAKAAVNLVRASASQKQFDSPAITMFGVGPDSMGDSRKQEAAWPIGKMMVPVKTLQSAGERDETRDESFIETALPELEGSPILLLASHGYPTGLVGGLKAADIRDRDFTGSVALNIACYNGVTGTWFEDDWSTKTVQQRQVDQSESFCLQMIDNGVAAYFCYVTPRPAGPNMLGDALVVASSGKSVGQLRMEDANRMILAHLMTGDDRLQITPMSTGQEIQLDRTPGDIVKRMSTGGILIGDPAFEPFGPAENADPQQQNVENTDTGMIVETKIKSPIQHMFTSEQINYWENTSPAMRVETMLMLDDQAIEEVRILEAPGEQYHFVAAVELRDGERWLRFKLTTPRKMDPETFRKHATSGVAVKFEVVFGDPLADQASDLKIIRGSKLKD